jgi:hypothetical protein
MYRGREPQGAAQGPAQIGLVVGVVRAELSLIPASYHDSGCIGDLGVPLLLGGAGDGKPAGVTVSGIARGPELVAIAIEEGVEALEGASGGDSVPVRRVAGGSETKENVPDEPRVVHQAPEEAEGADGGQDGRRGEAELGVDQQVGLARGKAALTDEGTPDEGVQRSVVDVHHGGRVDGLAMDVGV